MTLCTELCMYEILKAMINNVNSYKLIKLKCIIIEINSKPEFPFFLLQAPGGMQQQLSPALIQKLLQQQQQQQQSLQLMNLVSLFNTWALG